MHDTHHDYLRALQARGLADAEADVDTAAVMLTGTVMSDAMARSFVPKCIRPSSKRAARYVRCFLRMIGVKKTPPHPTEGTVARFA